MNILVGIAKVPDTTTKIVFNQDLTGLKTDGVQYVINPLDEFALTRAIEIKEALGGKVTVINVGLADTEPLMRKAFAIGADEGIRINAEPLDCYFVARQIALHASEQNYDLILLGRETSDIGSGQVCGMLAEMLGLPFVSGVPKLDIDGDKVTMERQIAGGKEVISSSMPLVASVQEGIAEPRIPTMRGIMSARAKPLNVIEPVEADSLTVTQNYELPPPKGGCKMVDAEHPEELIELLHNEAKVI